MNSPLDFQFNRFKSVCLIAFGFLVGFSLNQCPTTISECNAMYALNTSLNLPASITNYGSDASNPCSNKNENYLKPFIFDSSS